MSAGRWLIVALVWVVAGCGGEGESGTAAGTEAAGGVEDAAPPKTAGAEVVGADGALDGLLPRDDVTAADAGADTHAPEVGTPDVAEVPDGANVPDARGAVDTTDGGNAGPETAPPPDAAPPPTCLLCEAAAWGGSCVLLPGACRIDGACVAAGQSPPGDPCRLCAPSASPHAWSTSPLGTACDDGDPCTAADTCAQGSCAGGPDPCLGAGGPCAGAVCAAGECVMEPLGDGLPCQDGDPCTQGDACEAGQCAGVPANPCEDANPCTTDECVPLVGCTGAPLPGPCEDGSLCTQSDQCVEGQCQSGLPASCDDGDACTADTCHPLLGCGHAGICCGKLGVPCPTGFACTDKGTCQDDDEVFVPAGEFWMGCVEYPPYACRKDEVPVHLVVLSAYAIDRLEVTAGEFEVCVEAGACAPSDPSWLDDNTYLHPGEANLPMWILTWQQAHDYCAFEGKRLPSEAEWEKAAAGGCETIEGDCKEDRRPFPWGDAPPSCDLVVWQPVFGQWGCGQGQANPVGTKPLGASPYGVENMAGNVNEYVQDPYKGDYYCAGAAAVCDDACGACVDAPTNQDAITDPQGPPTGHIVLRGSHSDQTSPGELRVSRRYHGENVVSGGIRCARTLDAVD